METTRWPRRIATFHKSAAVGMSEAMFDAEIRSVAQVLPSDLMPAKTAFWEKVRESDEARLAWLDKHLTRLPEEEAQREGINTQEYPGGVTVLVVNSIARFQFEVTFRESYRARCSFLYK